MTYSYAPRARAKAPRRSGEVDAARFAVDGVSLTTESTEHVALLGPSGAGKSTFLALLAGFCSPTAGTIRFDGRLVSGRDVMLPPRARETGMVDQQLALWPHLSVDGHLEFVLRARGISRRERRRRKAEILELVELSPLARELPTTLSGGEAQRLALARALVARPRLLLLDEPLGGLDRALRAKMLRLISEAQARFPMTVIHVTHDFDEAAAVATRVAVLENGRLLQVGRPEELYRFPKNPSVARLAGNVNLLEGVYQEEKRVELPQGSYEAAFSALAGARVTVVVRPEDVEIRPSTAGGATVTRCRLREGRWEVEVEVEGATVLGYSRRPVSPQTEVEVVVREPVWGFEES